MVKIIEIRNKRLFYVVSQRFKGEPVVIGIATDPAIIFQLDEWHPTLRINALEQLGLSGSYEVDVDVLHVTADEMDARQVLSNTDRVMPHRWSAKPFDADFYRSSRPHVLCVDTGAVYKNANHAGNANGIASSQMTNHLALHPGYKRVGGLRFVRTAAAMTVMPPATKSRATALAIMTDEQRAAVLAYQNQIAAIKKPGI